MKRRTYKSDLKQMTTSQLKRWIDRKTDIMIQIGDTGGSTDLLTKIVYAKKLLASKN